jgi:hypothetical protein
MRVVVDWNVTSGQTHFVYIRGAHSNGIFGVSIEPLKVPVNDVWAAAGVLSLDDGIIQGNNENATDDIIEGIPCSQDSYFSSLGVWYELAGNNNFLRATVCEPSASESKSTISVYKGDCCDLVCVAESYFNHSGTSYTLSWEALEGVEFYLFVHHDPFALSGSFFELFIEEFEPAPNYQCSNAEGPLTPNNQTTVASTRDTVPDGVSDCLFGFNAPGLWNSVFGDEGISYRVDT